MNLLERTLKLSKWTKQLRMEIKFTSSFNISNAQMTRKTSWTRARATNLKKKNGSHLLSKISNTAFLNLLNPYMEPAQYKATL